MVGCFRKIVPKNCLQVLSTEQRAKAKASQAIFYDSRASTWSDVCLSNAAILLQNRGAPLNDVINLSAAPA